MLKSSQRTIPALALSSSFVQGVDKWQHQHGHTRPGHGHGQGQGKARKGTQHLTRAHAHVARFTKADLRSAAVLGQVDRKFVACVLRASAVDEDGEAGTAEGSADRGQTTLVLIDQHAADERVRVERILAELCAAFSRSEDHKAASSAVPVRGLAPPVRVLLTRHEAEQLVASAGVRRAFELWGVRLTNASLKSVENECSNVNNTGGKRQREDSGYVQVAVESVPEILAVKVRVCTPCTVMRPLNTRRASHSFSTATPCAISSSPTSPSSPRRATPRRWPLAPHTPTVRTEVPAQWGGSARCGGARARCWSSRTRGRAAARSCSTTCSYRSVARGSCASSRAPRCRSSVHTGGECCVLPGRAMMRRCTTLMFFAQAFARATCEPWWGGGHGEGYCVFEASAAGRLGAIRQRRS